MASARLTSKGRITIPKAIREHLGIVEGSVLEFIVDDAGKVLLRRHADDWMDLVLGALREFAPERSVTVDGMKAAVKARANRKV